MTHSQEKLDLARSLKPTGFIWIGMDDREEEGVFRWADSRLVSESVMGMFSTGNPNNYGGEDCVVVTGTTRKATLNDWYCHGETKFICEIPIE